MIPAEWTSREDAKLTELWAAGWLGRDIAAALGKSKNSVIGRAHRLHLPKRRQVSDRYLEAIRRRRTATQPPPVPKAGDEAAKAKRPLVPLRVDTRPHREPKPIVPKPPKPFRGKPICLVWAAPGQCRAPVREWAGPHKPFFCGGPVFGESSYCELHHRAFHVRGDRQSAKQTAAFAKWVSR